MTKFKNYLNYETSPSIPSLYERFPPLYTFLSPPFLSSLPSFLPSLPYLTSLPFHFLHFELNIFCSIPAVDILYENRENKRISL